MRFKSVLRGEVILKVYTIKHGKSMNEMHAHCIKYYSFVGARKAAKLSLING